MLALTIPWLLVILIIAAIVCLLKKKWKVSSALLIGALCLNWWSECVSIHLWPISDDNGGNCIKVMSFNIDGSTGDIKKKAPRIVSLIEKYSPDVVFIAEYCENNIPDLDTLLTKAYLYNTLCKKGYFHYFYSNYPLIEDMRLRDGDSQKGINIYTCKLMKDGDTVSLYGCHLPSNNYNAEMKRFSPDSIDTSGDALHYLCNIRQAHEKRERQTEIMINEMKGNANPIIVMGDINDVGGSATIRKMEQSGLRDAWWVGGWGYGATIHKPLPYRIDHILYSDDLKLMKIKVVDSQELSDHDALYAEFEIEK